MTAKPHSWPAAEQGHGDAHQTVNTARKRGAVHVAKTVERFNLPPTLDSADTATTG